MSATTTVPLTISPEAAERVTELGLQGEFKRMLDYVRATVPALRRLDVWVAEPSDIADDAQVIIELTKDDPNGTEDPTERELSAWEVRTFSPNACRFLTMLVAYGPSDAR